MSNDRHSCLSQVYGLSVLYCTVRPNVYQLVISRSGELRQLLLQELHNTSYAVHIGIRTTKSALFECFWWPNLAVDVKRFVAGC